jgi:type 2 lantibiotic biosynthesis protein LanM
MVIPKSSDPLVEALATRAVSIDELLSSDYEPVVGSKNDIDRAGKRLAAWCRSSCGGDWLLFNQRLERDGLSIAHVLSRFTAVRRGASKGFPKWVDDAIWIEAAFTTKISDVPLTPSEQEVPFAQLFTGVVCEAEKRAWARIDQRDETIFAISCIECLRSSLYVELSEISISSLYRLFRAYRVEKGLNGKQDGLTISKSIYETFIRAMANGGLRSLFMEKPVLLRLIATLTRQWIDNTSELLMRLVSDRQRIFVELLRCEKLSPISWIEGNLSDRHNAGKSVKLITFANKAKVVYKPKDLTVDATLSEMIRNFNSSNAPIDLVTARIILCDSYGWMEYVEHESCRSTKEFSTFFERAGAWLAILHCFVGCDIHEENLIASGAYPVVTDLEMILQSDIGDFLSTSTTPAAFEEASASVSNSVLTVGLLPSYGRSERNSIFWFGGMNSNPSRPLRVQWHAVNTDRMKPVRVPGDLQGMPNLPHQNGEYASLTAHLEAFVSGFLNYATFLRDTVHSRSDMFEQFRETPVRTVIRPTRAYQMLLQRLRNDQLMEDGIVWSAEADFFARLADWEHDDDVLWPLYRGERDALIALDVPYFISSTGSDEVRTQGGHQVKTGRLTGLRRAADRLDGLSDAELAWQTVVIRQSAASRFETRSAEHTALLTGAASDQPQCSMFLKEANQVATDIAEYAVVRSESASWIGLDWLGDSDFAQLKALGPDLYNGVAGIAIFLAGHAAATGCDYSSVLALTALSHLTKCFKSKSRYRNARAVGIGGATGLGSIVYALSVVGTILRENPLLENAVELMELFTEELITADTSLDVMDGCAGAVLGLLRVYRDTRNTYALDRAIRCGEHLLGQERVGVAGCRSWLGSATRNRPLAGVSHGASGFAYALSSLASTAGIASFAAAAGECVEYERSLYNSGRANWPDLRGEGEPLWSCSWCHGAPGIGLVRLAMSAMNLGTLNPRLTREKLLEDVEFALDAVKREWPNSTDTLCCGTLGSISFARAAGQHLDDSSLRSFASQRLASVVHAATSLGDYKWYCGLRRLNVGLFRGLAGVGYSCLQEIDTSLPNILVWE